MSRNHFTILAVLTLSAALPTMTGSLTAATCAIEPSFDCSQARGEVEKLVCRDSSLAELDNLLASAYATARENFPDQDRKSLQKSRQRWLKQRNSCATAEDMARCTRQAYEQRITDLQIQSGTLTVPEPVLYRCNSGKYDNLTAVFYNQTPLPAVVLTGNTGKDFWQEILFLAPSGSGARYQSEDLLFWSKGDEAIFERRGKSVTCSELKGGSNPD